MTCKAARVRSLLTLVLALAVVGGCGEGGIEDHRRTVHAGKGLTIASEALLSEITRTRGGPRVIQLGLKFRF